MATTQKFLWARYFWPTFFHDFILAFKMCEPCQHFAHKARAPPTPMHHMIFIGPLWKWGIDFMTLNPTSFGNHKYIIVVVNCFTKWAEAIPTYDNTKKIAAWFLFNHVISLFGVPKELVSDHGKHFENEVFHELSHHLGFTHEFTSPYYPQSNEHVEVVSKVLKTMTHHMVNKEKTNWNHMFLSALWVYHMAVKISTRFTPFHLVY